MLDLGQKPEPKLVSQLTVNPEVDVGRNNRARRPEIRLSNDVNV
jgi:hypothetical protein